MALMNPENGILSLIFNSDTVSASDGAVVCMSGIIDRCALVVRNKEAAEERVHYG